MTTATIEEYLQVIYILAAEGSPVISARVAERMGVSAPTMADTLRRLLRDGYVMVDGRKEIVLTEKGKDIAESLIRRHELLERWLMEALGLDSSRAHQEAHRLEHAISSEVEERLSRVIDVCCACDSIGSVESTGELDS